MRTVTRVTVLLFVGLLTAGPLLAVPLVTSPDARLTASDLAPAGRSSLLELVGYGLAVFGAIKVKDAAAVAAKYKTRAGAAQGDYKSGVEGAGADWETGAINGEGNYETGVQEAIAKKRFGRGIRQAGAAKYTRNAGNLGPQRYAQGVQNAEPAFAQGIAPVLEKIRSLNLPPRGPRRSPQNQARANMVALELGKMKDGQ